MTRNIAPELAPRVRVNAIDVGGVATRSLDIVLTDDDLRRQFLDGTPMHRPGEPEDIACAVLYLVSDASSWVTGQGVRDRRRHRGAVDAGAGAAPRTGTAVRRLAPGARGTDRRNACGARSRPPTLPRSRTTPT